MITRSQKIRLGIFISTGFLAIVITLLIILMPRLLEKKDVYYIGYRDISLTGLQTGSPVKYHGLTVGSVSDIFIDSNDIRRVIVEISLNIGTPIKKDTYADITILGITGLKLIELRGGSNQSENLEPGGFIQPGKSMTDLITGRAEVIAEKAEIIMNDLALLATEDNREKIESIIDNASKSMSDLQNILQTNQYRFTRTLANTETLTVDLQNLAKTTDKTMSNIEKITGSDSLKHIIGNLASITKTLTQSDLVGMINEMNTILQHTSNVLAEMDMAIARNQSDISQSINSLRESTEYLNQFSRMISEDPSILIRGTSIKNAPDKSLER